MNAVLEEKVKNFNISETRRILFLWHWMYKQANVEERVLLGDNTDREVVMYSPAYAADRTYGTAHAADRTYGPAYAADCT